jgi:serine/threonine-protein kinase HipA
VFHLLKQHLPAYRVESPRLFALLVFNYLFSNGDAHIKNFSILETPSGDFRLSPAYDLLNTSIHIDDHAFALDEGLLPVNKASGKVSQQFVVLAEEAGIPSAVGRSVMARLTTQSDGVARLVAASFLDDKTKKQYWQAYQQRLKKLGGGE